MTADRLPAWVTGPSQALTAADGHCQPLLLEAFAWVKTWLWRPELDGNDQSMLYYTSVSPFHQVAEEEWSTMSSQLRQHHINSSNSSQKGLKVLKLPMNASLLSTQAGGDLDFKSLTFLWGLLVRNAYMPPRAQVLWCFDEQTHFLQKLSPRMLSVTPDHGNSATYAWKVAYFINSLLIAFLPSPEQAAWHVFISNWTLAFIGQRFFFYCCEEIVRFRLFFKHQTSIL